MAQPKRIYSKDHPPSIGFPLLQGLYDALCRWTSRANSLQEIRIIEKDPARAREIQEGIEEIQRQPEGLVLDLRKHTFTRSHLSQQNVSASHAEEIATRITIERDGDLFRFSALTTNAVVPVRELAIQSFLADGAAERLKQAATLSEQEQYGRLLYTYLLPEEFQRLFSGDQGVTLVLDRATAAFPWEMACFGAPGGLRWLGTHLRLTRQFRTLLSSAPGLQPPLNRELRVLVIADPAPEPEYRLEGARREGQEVVQVLTKIKNETDLKLEIVDRIGPDQCDPIEILGLLLNGDFDVVHFAGHGSFDAKYLNRGGWIFGNGRVLSAREIFPARRVPRLVVANACFSAIVRPGQALEAREKDKALAGLAEAFFERGVQNFIGSGWPVADDAAVEFAKTLYTKALAGTPVRLRDAVSAARQSIQTKGPTWGAYQHYGVGTTELVSPSPRKH